MFSYSAHLFINVHCSAKLKNIILFYLTFLSLSIKIIHLFLSLFHLFLFIRLKSQPSLFLLYLFNIFSLFFLHDRRWRKCGDGVIGDGDDWSSLSRSSSDPPLSPTQLTNPSPKSQAEREMYG